MAVGLARVRRLREQAISGRGVAMNERRLRRENYYEARGFSVYYLANAVFSIVSNSGAYLRGIGDILDDTRVLTLMRPFHRYTNLHHFIREISVDIVTEKVDDDD